MHRRPRHYLKKYDMELPTKSWLDDLQTKDMFVDSCMEKKSNPSPKERKTNPFDKLHRDYLIAYNKFQRELQPRLPNVLPIILKPPTPPISMKYPDTTDVVDGMKYPEEYFDSRQFKYELQISFDSEWNNEYQPNIPNWLYELHPPYRVINALKLLLCSSLIKPFKSSDIELRINMEDISDVFDVDLINTDIQSLVLTKQTTQPVIRSMYFMDYIDLAIQCPMHDQSAANGSYSGNHNNNTSDKHKHNGGTWSNSNNNNNDSNSDRNGNGGDGDDEKGNPQKNNQYQSQPLISYNQLLSLCQFQYQQITQQKAIIKQQDQKLQLKEAAIKNLIQLNHTLSQKDDYSLALAMNAMSDANKLKHENQRLKRRISQLSSTIRSMKTVKSPKSMSNSNYHHNCTPSLSRTPSASYIPSVGRVSSLDSSASSTSSPILISSSSPSPKNQNSYIMKHNDNNKHNKKRNTSKQTLIHELSYEPHPDNRLNSNIHLPRGLASKMKAMISNNLEAIECGRDHKNKKCNCDGLYTYLEIDIAMQFNNDQNKVNDSRKVFNTGLVDKENKEDIYLIIDEAKEAKDDANWIIKNEIYNKKMLYDKFTSIQIIPSAVRASDEHKRELDKAGMIREYFKDSKNIQLLINHSNWCKLPVFGQIENNRRRSLLIRKPEFTKDLKTRNKLNELTLIPILMFRGYHYEIHHLIIVEIDNCINIGISFIYDTLQNKARATGIHIDKRLLLRQHQLISLQHMSECKCFDHFKSTINHLSIGNPNDLQNKINALKNKKAELQEKLDRQLNSCACSISSPSSSLNNYTLGGMNNYSSSNV